MSSREDPRRLVAGAHPSLQNMSARTCSVEFVFEKLRGRAFDVEDRAHPYAVHMAVSAHVVAAVLSTRMPGLPAKKLHKLLYYCQGHHLAALGMPLFDESISAWDMGPVVGKLWYEQKHGAGGGPGADLDESQLNTIGYVLSRYGALTGRDLEHLTHSEAPWQLANRDRRPGESVLIRREWLRDYFSADAEDEEAPLDSETVSKWLQRAEERRARPVRRDSLEELQARLARHG